jgi:hypothetical protein
MEERLIESATNIIQPVLESAVIIASHYCRATGRDTVTAMDMQYGMKYAARHVLGTRTGTMFPEDNSDNSDNSSDSDSLPELVSDEDEDEDNSVFTRYTGDDKTFIEINECFDTWAEWEPDSPAGVLLKNAIDSNGVGGVNNKE